MTGADSVLIGPCRLLGSHCAGTGSQHVEKLLGRQAVAATVIAMSLTHRYLMRKHCNARWPSWLNLLGTSSLFGWVAIKGASVGESSQSAWCWFQVMKVV